MILKQKLPEQVADIKKAVDKLLDGNTRVNEAVERLASLDVILKDTETRISEMQKLENGLQEQKLELTRFQKKHKSKLKLWAIC